MEIKVAVCWKCL